MGGGGYYNESRRAAHRRGMTKRSTTNKKQGPEMHTSRPRVQPGIQYFRIGIRHCERYERQKDIVCVWVGVSGWAAGYVFYALRRHSDIFGDLKNICNQVARWGSAARSKKSKCSRLDRGGTAEVTLQQGEQRGSAGPAYVPPYVLSPNSAHLDEYCTPLSNVQNQPWTSRRKVSAAWGWL